MQEDTLDEPEFTDEELRAALIGVGRDARETAFAAGRPVFIIRGASIVALDPDGTERIVESLSQEIEAASDHQ